MKNNAGFQTIALTRIHESTTTIRGIFDESRLAELAASSGAFEVPLSNGGSVLSWQVEPFNEDHSQLRRGRNSCELAYRPTTNFVRPAQEYSEKTPFLSLTA
jgi:hypothetical protein